MFETKIKNKVESLESEIQQIKDGVLYTQLLCVVILISIHLHFLLLSTTTSSIKTKLTDINSKIEVKQSKNESQR